MIYKTLRKKNKDWKNTNLIKKLKWTRVLRYDKQFPLH
jgi:hypothetical protein